MEMERPLGGVHFKPDTLRFSYNLLRGVCVAKTSKKKPSDLLKSITAPTRQISRSLNAAFDHLWYNNSVTFFPQMTLQS